MTRKKRSAGYFCTECGNETPRWLGQCPACKAWNTLVEAPERRAGSPRGHQIASWLPDSSPGTTAPVSLEEVQDEAQPRLATGIAEFDFVLGGGIVPGSFVLLGGAPGVGKSTILTQVASKLNASGHSVLYVSGEESAHQVKMRARRIGPEATKLRLLAETEVGRIIAIASEERPAVLVIDSIQTLHSDNADGPPGNITQVRECGAILQRYAKEHRVAVFAVGHVTKDGSLAGPRILEHMVDTVIYFEHTGDYEHRIMRAIKNRFGSADEIGVFRMQEHGLVPVENPSHIFLTSRTKQDAGSAVTTIIEGSRPVLVEVQGLVTPASYGAPQRVAEGYSRKRLAILLAVMEKQLRIPFRQLDVFLNVVGGLSIHETAPDAAIAAALASSSTEQPLPQDSIFLGEIGLGGELRRVRQIDRRIAEAVTMGFRQIFIPKAGIPTRCPNGVRIVGIEHVGELIERALTGVPQARTHGTRPTPREKNPARKTGRRRVMIQSGSQ